MWISCHTVRLSGSAVELLPRSANSSLTEVTLMSSSTLAVTVTGLRKAEPCQGSRERMLGAPDCSSGCSQLVATLFAPSTPASE